MVRRFIRSLKIQDLFVEAMQLRIDAMKEWIRSQSYKEVVVVGHSAYFKLWLKASSKMDNCHIESTTL